MKVVENNCPHHNKYDIQVDTTFINITQNSEKKKKYENDLKASSPWYLSLVELDRKSLSMSLANDFCTSLPYGEWKRKASALSRLKGLESLPLAAI